jgi:hypothetical protein
MPPPVGALTGTVRSRGAAPTPCMQVENRSVPSRKSFSHLRLPFSVAVTAALVPLIAIGNGCGGMEFCEEGSKECSADAGGSAGSSSGGSSGKGGGSAGGDAGATQGGSTGSGGTENVGGEGQGGTGGVMNTGPCDLASLTEGCSAPTEGIFVSPSGSDENDGSQDSPVATIAQGAELAGAADVPLFLCNETFDEHVVFDNIDDLTIYGAFTCDAWLHTPEAKTVVAPSTAGYALHIDDSSVITISDVEFRAISATAKGESSIAAFVTQSEDISLTRVKLVAGEGEDGADGTLTSFAFADASELNGYAEIDSENGSSRTCACQPTLESVGGLGGSPVSGGQAGSTGQPNHGGGQGGTPGPCSPDGGGKDGNPAPDETSANGAQTLGTLTLGAWTPESGSDGTTGQPGQGGGGGASRHDSGHGGGGGCGGCGGNGGKGGKGGGASVALLAMDASISLNGSAIETAGAGDGGSGHAGQAGQQDIGSGGSSISTNNSCDGGSGGPGGDGGAGGGGAGGVSVGILYVGADEPIVDEATTFSIGNAGLAGVGGDAGVNDGIDGVSAEVHLLE